MLLLSTVKQINTLIKNKESHVQHCICINFWQFLSQNYMPLLSNYIQFKLSWIQWFHIRFMADRASCGGNVSWASKQTHMIWPLLHVSTCKGKKKKSVRDRKSV